MLAVWEFIKKWWWAFLSAIGLGIVGYARYEKQQRALAEKLAAEQAAKAKVLQLQTDAVIADRAVERIVVRNHEAEVYKAQFDADAKMADIDKKQEQLPGPKAAEEEVADAWNKRIGG